MSNLHKVPYIKGDLVKYVGRTSYDYKISPNQILPVIKIEEGIFDDPYTTVQFEDKSTISAYWWRFEKVDQTT